MMANLGEYVEQWEQLGNWMREQINRLNKRLEILEANLDGMLEIEKRIETKATELAAIEVKHVSFTYDRFLILDNKLDKLLEAEKERQLTEMGLRKARRGFK